MGFLYDLFIMLLAIGVFCLTMGIAVAYIFHRVVEKLDRNNIRVVDGQIYNTEKDAWEDL